jgi:polysaccharide export outer membrane protein
MMIKYWPIIWVLSFFLVLSCSANKEVKDGIGTKGIIDRQEEISPPSPSILGSGDEIIINVWRHDDLKRAIQIDPSGNIYLPLAGEIQASGLTISQLREEVTLRLSKYLTDPQVDISVSRLKSQKIYILGEVKSPRSLTLDREMLVWEAISQAGGFTDEANENKVLLVRSEKDVARVTALNLNIRRMLKNGKLAQNVYLKNGDIVYVPPSLIADLERFMRSFQTIIGPFIQVGSGIVVWDEAIKILRGDITEREVIVTP